MNKTCTSPNCPKAAALYGNLCPTHQKHVGRWGALEQRPLKVGDLKKIKDQMETILTSQPTFPTLKPTLLNAVVAIRAETTAVEAFYSEKRPVRLPRLEHDKAVRRICSEVDHWEIVKTVVGLAYRNEADPRAFVNDAALWATTARRLHVRTTSGKISYRSRSNSSGAVKTYSDLRPDVNLAIGKTFQSVFGPFAIQLYAQVKAKEEAIERAKQAVHMALDPSATDTANPEANTAAQTDANPAV